MEYKFRNLNLPLYDKNHFVINFCYFEIDDWGDVNIVFWIHNMTKKIISVRASDVFINGEADTYVEGDEICNILPDDGGYYRLSMPWDDVPSEKQKIKLCLSLYGNYNNALDKSFTLRADVNFDKKTQKAEVVKTYSDYYWFDWTLLDLLYEYIKEMTINNNFAWIETKLLDRKGARVFNDICGDTMTDDDLPTETAFLGTIYMSMFEKWLLAKGVNVLFGTATKNSHYEVVHWNLRSSIDSKYEITQIYLVDKQLRSFNLFYSFEKDDLAQAVKANANFYKSLPALTNDEENLSRRMVFAINQERAAIFLKTYKSKYDLPTSNEKLDARIEKWNNVSKLLIEESKKLEEKKLMETSLGESLDMSVREYNTFYRHGIRTLADAISKDGDYYKRRYRSTDILKLLIGLDKLGLRISDADKIIYPRLENYLKKLCVCDSCGKELDYEGNVYFRRWVCRECSEKSHRVYSNKSITLRACFEKSENILSFKVLLGNQTTQPLKIAVDDVSLFYDRTLLHGKIDDRYPSFTEDYIFPNTERAVERVWDITNCEFQNRDYLAVYLTDKTNNKRYYFMLKYNPNNLYRYFELDDFYELES